MLELPRIDEIDQLEQVEKLIATYRDRFGVDPINLSHWDPSAPFAARVQPAFQPPAPVSPFPYIYSYTLDAGAALVTRLGFDPDRYGCLVTPSGTVAMLCAVHWLRAQGSPPLTALGPLYFPLVHQASLEGIPVERRFMVRGDDGWSMPADLFQASPPALWVTNPVYCTGVPLSGADAAALAAYVQTGGRLVLDECFARDGTHLGPHLARDGSLIALYTPHKALCMNGLKFGLVVFESRYQEFFDQWADVLYGPLNMTTAMAVGHFLSDNFRAYARTFDGAIEPVATFLTEAVAASGAGALDAHAAGHFRSAYYPTIPAARGADEAFLLRVMEASGAVVLSGVRNHFDPALGLCFRINLALDGPPFRSAVRRLVRELASAANGR